jgi:ribosomal protein L11
MSARNETPHVIIQTLGQKKCNGDWEASTENLSMEQVKQVAEKQKDRLTGSSVYARSREVMGTCVAMRVKVEGMEPKAALQAMEEGRFNEHFE